MLEPRLYLHAEPHLDESCTSWLIRTAEIHGLTLQELFSALRVRKRRDLDLVVVPRVLRYFTRGMEYPIATLEQMTMFYRLFRTDQWAHVWLKTLDSGVPGTGYCPLCLAEDRQPYWRATWRFRFWLICPEHCCWISHACPGCEAPVLIPNYFKRRPFALGLSLCTTCAKCGTDLRLATSEVYLAQEMAFDELKGLQCAITAALLRGSFRLFGLDEDLPLALLPSVLVASGTRASKTSLTVSQILSLELKAGATALAKGGPPGFFVKDQIAAAGQAVGPAWKGQAGYLASLVLRSRLYWVGPLEGRDHSNRVATNRLVRQCHELKWGF